MKAYKAYEDPYEDYMEAILKAILKAIKLAKVRVQLSCVVWFA